MWSTHYATSGEPEKGTRSWAVYPMKVGDAVSLDEGPASFSEFDEADLVL